MKSWQRMVLVALALLGVLPWVLGWLEREGLVSLGSGFGAPAPGEELPPLRGQMVYPRGTTVTMWGELVAKNAARFYLVGVFRSPINDEGPPRPPDVQGGYLVGPGPFRMELPASVGPVYVYALASNEESPEVLPRDLPPRIAFAGNPLIVGNQGQGGIVLTVP